ncbi:MAG: DUF3857 domain-containing protein [Bacteroidia bacterium]|nr:DUF3857 domain-containing protein [Bacteroidia bacterium]
MRLSGIFRSSGAVILLLLLHFTHIRAQNYPVREIPPALLQNSNAVIRNYDTRFTVISNENAREEVSFAVTVLNESGLKYAEIYLQEDRFQKPVFLGGAIYDALGERLTRLTPAILSESNPYSTMSLYDDNRVKEYQPKVRDYPFTVEYKYETTYKGLLWYPGWRPQAGYGLAVEKSTFVVEMDMGEELRFRERGITTGVKTKVENGRKTWIWVMENQPARESEPFELPLRESMQAVFTAPGKFSFGGQEGNMKTWQGLGKWFFDLNHDVNDLQDGSRANFPSEIAQASSPREKVAAIYRYMQSHTRYVGIQLGIGGWKSFPASTTEAKGFGDCKALTQYTHNLLALEGIKSYPALIQAGKRRHFFLADFPSNQFNHVILCVPLGSDTLWLECTSQDNPCGYLGTFTDNRPALLITEKGGILRKTPALGAHDNCQSHTARVELDETGGAQILLISGYSGINYEAVSDLPQMTEEERRKRIYQNLTLPAFELKREEWNQLAEKIPRIKADMELSVRRLAPRTGKRMFFSPNLLNVLPALPPETHPRMGEVYLANALLERDTITFTLPPGSSLEYTPSRLDTSCIFGSYQAEYLYNADNNTLTYVRSLQLNSGRQPAEKYPVLERFFHQVREKDLEQLVLKFDQ